MNRLEILYRPLAEYGTRHDSAIHVKDPSYRELQDMIDQADRDMFKLIVVYSDRDRSKLSNIFNGMSTWNRLRRDYGDVRYGEVGFKHGTSLGEGFQIYFKEGN